jgi:hypothetical protein
MYDGASSNKPGGQRPSDCGAASARGATPNDDPRTGAATVQGRIGPHATGGDGRSCRLGSSHRRDPRLRRCSGLDRGIGRGPRKRHSRRTALVIAPALAVLQVESALMLSGNKRSTPKAVPVGLPACASSRPSARLGTRSEASQLRRRPAAAGVLSGFGELSAEARSHGAAGKDDRSAIRTLRAHG